VCRALAIAQAPPTHTATEAAKHIGETAIVKDRVDGFHKSGKGNIFLNMGGKYPNQAFTAFIPSSLSQLFRMQNQAHWRTEGVRAPVGSEVFVLHLIPN
jgi:hypothetical protein